MRILLTLVLTTFPAVAQIPLVNLFNASHPGRDLQIGDRFHILITAAPDQPVSVRTFRQGRTDWSPVIGSTDSTGRWSTDGRFEKKDFGDWAERWTVGGKLASPVIQFWVNAPCLPTEYSSSSISGPNVSLHCETAEGDQTFATPSRSDSFRTPDGRLVEGRPSNQTPDEYQSEILQYLMETGMSATPVALQSPHGGGRGDETADLISKLIGVNALNEVEIRNSLAIVRAAFDDRENIRLTAREPVRTLLLLQLLAGFTDQESLKQEIAETAAYVQHSELKVSLGRY